MAIDNLIRIGKVAQVFPERARVRVDFEDVEMVSAELYVMVHRAIGTKDYWMPKVTEDVICLFLDSNTGFVIGSWYGDNDIIPGNIQPTSNDDIRAIEFENGSKFIFDVKNNHLLIDCPKDITVTLKNNIDIHMPPDKNINYYKDLTSDE